MFDRVGSEPGAPGCCPNLVVIARSSGASIEVLLADVNARIREHGGIILANRQILRRPIELDWDVQGYLDDYTTTPFEHPEREWEAAQSQYDRSTAFRSPD